MRIYAYVYTYMYIPAYIYMSLKKAKKESSILSPHLPPPSTHTSKHDLFEHLNFSIFYSYVLLLYIL